jgi:hypothetical protein
MRKAKASKRIGLTVFWLNIPLCTKSAPKDMNPPKAMTASFGALIGSIVSHGVTTMVAKKAVPANSLETTDNADLLITV